MLTYSLIIEDLVLENIHHIHRTWSTYSSIITHDYQSRKVDEHLHSLQIVLALWGRDVFGPVGDFGRRSDAVVDSRGFHVYLPDEVGWPLIDPTFHIRFEYFW